MNRLFANHADRFANRANRLPGFAPILIGSVVALFFATLTGAFGTGGMAVGPRLGFWALVIGVNSLLWLGWFAWQIRSHRDWWRACLVGIIVLTLPLPLEIMLAAGLSTGQWPTPRLEVWGHGLGVGAGLLLLAAAIQALWPRPVVAPDFGKSALWRHGVRDPASLAAIVAEDHYCRLWRRDGSSLLVHGRFADLVGELHGADGLVIRRGVWAAANGVGGVERDGRRLLVRLAHGELIPASASGRAAMRDAGWV
ncbi:MAG: hypothetical protein ABIT69_06615 [Sphingomicrobium sp.]